MTDIEERHQPRVSPLWMDAVKSDETSMCGLSVSSRRTGPRVVGVVVLRRLVQLPWGF